jgi:hypothetical protein
MDEHVARQIEPVDESWRNLGELQEWALRQGFTHDQFGYALDRVGSNPHDVANELQRLLLLATLQEDRLEEMPHVNAVSLANPAAYL